MSSFVWSSNDGNSSPENCHTSHQHRLSWMGRAEYGIRLDPVLNSELAGDSLYRSGCLQHLY
ncbi:unnamed protein product [Linum tenue]|uniref:Uncharacterized protein n=1 Tax=Linum tenue TaxID=586396 RepID=A0AAV0HQK2_9ROSI|nr:unnamed protein product [Linum tenue]